MLFTGQFEHLIDSKARLAIPASIRNRWDPERDGAEWKCVPRSGELKLYTETTYQHLADAMAEQTLTPDTKQASRNAVLHSYTAGIVPDSAGRITIPKLHLKISGLGGEVMVLGSGQYLSVVDREKWLQNQERHLGLLDEMLGSADPFDL